MLVAGSTARRLSWEVRKMVRGNRGSGLDLCLRGRGHANGLRSKRHTLASTLAYPRRALPATYRSDGRPCTLSKNVPVRPYPVDVLHVPFAKPLHRARHGVLGVGRHPRGPGWSSAPRRARPLARAAASSGRVAKDRRQSISSKMIAARSSPRKV